ncbi:hypothetical protein GPU06_08350, partial [Streptococcus thermophilus]|nr:hypothetical protein [Streptococcus thermophilus]MCE2084553.1 hypothetical protein [Streptococcus thermophilus]
VLSAFKKLYNLYSSFTHYRNYRAVITLMAQRTGNAYPLDRMLFMQ